jgi:hypothetical protein
VPYRPLVFDPLSSAQARAGFYTKATRVVCADKYPTSLRKQYSNQREEIGRGEAEESLGIRSPEVDVSNSWRVCEGMVLSRWVPVDITMKVGAASDQVTRRW